MQLHELRILRELGERGSVAAVAAALLVTPSAVSQHLAALQRGFQVPLTEKRGRRLELTDAGRALAAAGTRVSVAMADAAAAVDDFLEDTTADVSVSAFHSAGLAWFQRLLVDTSSGPRISLSDRDVSFSEFPRLTLDYDLVIAHRLVHGQPWPSDRLIAVPLLTEPLDIAVAASHPLASRDSVTIDEVASERWVSVHDGFPLADLLTPIAMALGAPLDIAHRVNEFFVASMIIRTGQAVGLMPRHTMQHADLDGIVLLSVDDLPLARQIDVLARPEALHRRAVREVVAALRGIAAQTETAQTGAAQTETT